MDKQQALEQTYHAAAAVMRFSSEGYLRFRGHRDGKGLSSGEANGTIQAMAAAQLLAELLTEMQPEETREAAAKAIGDDCRQLLMLWTNRR